jgi:Flp pilus assembly pilin Flp
MSGRYKKMENAMLWNEMKRLVREDAGMEMVEWSIVGVVFALAGALLWSTLKTQINSGLDSIGKCVGNSALCPGGAAP